MFRTLRELIIRMLCMLQTDMVVVVDSATVMVV